jgi:hypothetical protein
VRIGKDGRRRTIYDFSGRLSEARPFVVLDSDGAERRFDGVGEDSTGATFKVMAANPTDALRAGEGRQWQWVEGYQSSRFSDKASSGQYPCFLGTALSWFAYASDAGEAAWVTTPVPAARETAVAFVGGTNYAPGRAELWCDGRRLLEFDTGRSSNAVWRDSGVELRYLHGRDTKIDAAPYGLSGVFVLRLPASKISPGKPQRLSVKMKPGGAGWFVLHAYGNALRSGPVIAAFTPHKAGRYGITGADYAVDVKAMLREKQ